MTRTEVERKRSLDADTQVTLLERLRELGFCERARHTETDDYYSRPDVDFMETVECLRVRSRDGFAEITYKPGSTAVNTEDGVISRVETNARLAGADQAEAANHLLAMLGMVPLARVENAASNTPTLTTGTSPSPSIPSPAPGCSSRSRS